MGTAFKIWALAIIYQNVIFSIMPGEFSDGLVLFLIPVELAGGLPGLFLFGAIMYSLYIGQYPLIIKWLIAVFGAIFSALATTLLTALFFEVKPAELFNDVFYLLYPAPLSALLSLLTFIPSVNKYFDENTIEKNP